MHIVHEPPREIIHVSELKRITVIFYHWNIYIGNYNGKREVLKCTTFSWQNKSMTALILMYTLEKCKFADKPKQNVGRSSIFRNVKMLAEDKAIPKTN